MSGSLFGMFQNYLVCICNYPFVNINYYFHRSAEEYLTFFSRSRPLMVTTIVHGVVVMSL